MLQRRARATAAFWLGLGLALALAGLFPANALALEHAPQGANLASGSSSGSSSGVSSRYIVSYAATQQAQAFAAINQFARSTPQPLPQHNAVTVKLSTTGVLALQTTPAITVVEIDPRRYLYATQTPFRSTQSNGYARQLVQADLLSPFGTPRTVCVIDSGYQLGHADLPGQSRVTGASMLAAAWMQPDNAHGTAVAAVIAALDNAEGTVGVHPGAGLQLHNVRLFAPARVWAFASDLVLAADNCLQNDANVVSLSLGGLQESEFERRAFARYAARGVLSVAAAGNNGRDACSYPACYDSVISVGAVDRSKHIAPFSQTSEQLELVAPGVNVLTADLNSVTAWSGTSMAAPHVAGGAALLWSLNPGCNAAAIRTALTQAAEDLGPPGRDAVYGYGLLQLRAAESWLSDNGCT